MKFNALRILDPVATALCPLLFGADGEPVPFQIYPASHADFQKLYAEENERRGKQAMLLATRSYTAAPIKAAAMNPKRPETVPDWVKEELKAQGLALTKKNIAAAVLSREIDRQAERSAVQETSDAEKTDYRVLALVHSAGAIDTGDSIEDWSEDLGRKILDATEQVEADFCAQLLGDDHYGGAMQAGKLFAAWLLKIANEEDLFRPERLNALEKKPVTTPSG